MVQRLIIRSGRFFQVRVERCLTLAARGGRFLGSHLRASLPSNKHCRKMSGTATGGVGRDLKTQAVGTGWSKYEILPSTALYIAITCSLDEQSVAFRPVSHYY